MNRILSPFLMGAPQAMQQPGGVFPMAGNGYPMGSPFPAAPSGLAAQTPQSGPSGFMGGLRNLMQPGNMLPIAAQLMGNQGNMANIGNAMMAGAQGAAQRSQQNKTLEYLRRTDPELAEMVEATGMPVKDALEISQQRLKAQTPELLSVGGHLYDKSNQRWISPPDGGGSETHGTPIYTEDEEGNIHVNFAPKSGQALTQMAPREGQRVLGPYDTAEQRARGGEIGKQTGAAQMELGSALEKADQSIALIDQMIEHPGRATATGLSATFDPRNYLAGTEATNFNVMKAQLEGKAFLEAFESLKGGGQITEVEGRKATEAIARLNTAQSDEAYLEALYELRGILELGKSRALRRAGQATTPPASGTSMRDKYGLD